MMIRANFCGKTGSFLASVLQSPTAHILIKHIGSTQQERETPDQTKKETQNRNGKPRTRLGSNSLAYKI